MASAWTARGGLPVRLQYPRHRKRRSAARYAPPIRAGALERSGDSYCREYRPNRGARHQRGTQMRCEMNSRFKTAFGLLVLLLVGLDLINGDPSRSGLA